MAEHRRTAIEIGLNAAIVAVESGIPRVYTVPGEAPALPFGPFDPVVHRTLEIGLRAWVEEQTGLELDYVEQLYTFGDRGRLAPPGGAEPHVVSVGYLALTRLLERGAAENWLAWYDFFPWEDWRDGRPDILDREILPALDAFVAEPPPPDAPIRPLDRVERVRLAFGTGGSPWDEEKALERYELLYEAGLVAEAVADGRPVRPWAARFVGRAMRHDHRRILATAISRLRAKIKYRPVVFELMPPNFTLTALQGTVEAISGRHLHKQNFRRLVETGALVEPTGASTDRTGGRPAQLFRFRREVLRERPAPGVRVGAR
ncbi:NUDIX hydrolase [Chthonobacter rhizosphaerae]|uniref:NUDIX hydrolase n=1 Tax=Chthonobacter rhizosphaerae TaxID=2735553 RepID=UPI0015EE4920|nr:NAD regulator [Chthonobacter rhizosphaerae]